MGVCGVICGPRVRCWVSRKKKCTLFILLFFWPPKNVFDSEQNAKFSTAELYTSVFFFKLEIILYYVDGTQR